VTMGTTRQTTTRLAAARRRASLAKRVLAAGSAVAFAVAFLLARASHPGQTSSPSSAGTDGSQVQESESESEDDGFTFGTPSVAPSTGTPQAQTHVS
jgi:hypothetical protein